MTRYLLLALAVLAVLCGGWGAWEHQRAERHKLSADQWEQTATEAAATIAGYVAREKLHRETSLARQKELNRLRQLADAYQKALHEAAQADPSWATAPVPDRVWDALTGPLAPGEAGPGVDGGGARAPAYRP